MKSALSRGGKLQMAWVYLLSAGFLEVAWVIGLKYTEGWTKLYASMFTLAAMILDFILLSLALKTLPLGTAYAIWTGIGAAGTAVLGIILFGESREVGRIACFILIIAGIVGLKLTSSPPKPPPNNFRNSSIKSGSRRSFFLPLPFCRRRAALTAPLADQAKLSFTDTVDQNLLDYSNRQVAEKVSRPVFG